MVKEGHNVGNHTFNHPNVIGMSEEQFGKELSMPLISPEYFHFRIHNRMLNTIFFHHSAPYNKHHILLEYLLIPFLLVLFLQHQILIPNRLHLLQLRFSLIKM